ncbi:MAG: hypothetical protein C7B45_11655 [Sulfobacillus acidophilus]|uniref:SAF domain-containing protein n=1 Tax=Sulfobacillus acidophilus TaxID=53633 RepID=A0A2T2WGC4_9FIRM|nr:MAG: hypothetical protein C7B45_11655 [Sulfobacillus acidophilus]
MTIKSWKERLQAHAGLVAFAMSALVFAILTLAKPHVSKTTVLVPVMKRFVAQGSRVRTSDIEWVSESQLHTVPMSHLTGFAKIPLFPGTIVAPADVGQFSAETVLVAVQPSNAVDARTAVPGGYVDVLVAANHFIKWQSGPLPVVSRSLADGSQASVEVAMRLRQALAYEQAENQGSVELVGFSS